MQGLYGSLRRVHQAVQGGDRVTPRQAFFSISSAASWGPPSQTLQTVDLPESEGPVLQASGRLSWVSRMPNFSPVQPSIDGSATIQCRLRLR